MSYAIFEVIYGLPLTEAASKWIYDNSGDEDTLDEWDELGFDDMCGFKTLYSASATSSAGYFGVSLMSFDECADYIAIEEISVQPTEDQRKEIDERIKKLPKELREILPKPGIYVIPSSS